MSSSAISPPGRLRVLEGLIVMPIGIASLRHAIGAIAARLEAECEMLNELDGTVGDGDLGITLLKAFRELDRIKDELPDDLGAAFLKGAGAVSKVSSSSFGTLLATGLIAAGKETKGVTAIPASEVSRLLEKAGAAMAARGRSSLGDKTVLDTLAGAARPPREGRFPRHVRRRP